MAVVKLPLVETMEESVWGQLELGADHIVEKMLKAGWTDDVAVARNFYATCAEQEWLNGFEGNEVDRMEAIARHYWRFASQPNDFEALDQAILDMSSVVYEQYQEGQPEVSEPHPVYEPPAEAITYPPDHHEAKYVVWWKAKLVLANGNYREVTVTIREGMTNREIDEMYRLTQYANNHPALLSDAEAANQAREFMQNGNRPSTVSPQSGNGRATAPAAPTQSQTRPRGTVAPATTNANGGGQPRAAANTGARATGKKGGGTSRPLVKKVDDPNTVKIWSFEEINGVEMALRGNLKEGHGLIRVFAIKRLTGKNESNGLEFLDYQDGALVKVADGWDNSDHNDPETNFKNIFLDVDSYKIEGDQKIYGDLLRDLWNLKKGETLYFPTAIFFQTDGKYIKKRLTIPTTWDKEPFYGAPS